MPLTVAAIVPAFDEEIRIQGTLSFLSESPMLNEVICINDGSTDKTRQIIHSVHGVQCIDLPVNKGKANAIVEGIIAARSDCILLIDADLSGVSDAALKSLIEPLQSGQFDVAIGFPSKIEDITLFRPLTGERCYFRQDLLPHLEYLRTKGYGLELALNYLFRNKRIKFSRLQGVSQLHKAGKYGVITSMKRELSTWKELIGEISNQDNPLAYTYGAYMLNFYLKRHRQL